jgi:hypothetical protein
MSEIVSRPIFILGNPRSGTTLLRLLLAAHPRLAVPPECGFVLWLLPEFGAWSLADTSDPARVEAFLQALQKCRKYDSWDLPIETVAATLRARQPACYVALVEAVYWAFIARHKPLARRWGDKNNFHTRHVLQLNQLFPNCQFVQIVRDVRDVACSYRDMGRLQSNNAYRPRLPAEVEAIAADWMQNISAVESAFAALPSERKFTLRYEDLVRDSHVVLREVCRFLDESFDPAMCDFYRLNLEPSHTLEWKQKTREPVGADRVERFRAELPDAEIASLTESCRDWLAHYHYPR